MELIKENLEKKRAVYRKDDNTIRKIWYGKDLAWADNHVYTIEKVFPGYVKKFSAEDDHAWIDFKFIEGTLASTLPHTEEFVLRIKRYCHENYKKTFPYAHGDWVLSNMIIDNEDNIHMIDWDNLKIWDPEDVYSKIHSDLKSAFGEKYEHLL